MKHPLNKFFDKILVLTTTHDSCKNRISRFKHRNQKLEYEFFYGKHAADMDINFYRESGCEPITDGQISCSVNHLSLYQYIIDSNIPNCLILEDDAVVTEDLDYIEKCLSQLPLDWKLFYLGYINYHPIYPNYSNNLIKFSAKNYITLDCTFGFAITKELALELYDANKTINNTADGSIQRLIKQNDIDVYAATPKIIEHEGLESILAMVDRGDFKK